LAPSYKVLRPTFFRSSREGITKQKIGIGIAAAIANEALSKSIPLWLATMAASSAKAWRWGWW